MAMKKAAKKSVAKTTTRQAASAVIEVRGVDKQTMQFLDDIARDACTDRGTAAAVMLALFLRREGVTGKRKARKALGVKEQRARKGGK